MCGSITGHEEISRSAWLEWVKSSILEAPESAEASSRLGPPQAKMLVPDFTSDWPQISSNLEEEVRQTLGEYSLPALMKENEELLCCKYRSGSMRFFYNLFASTTTQHFHDDVSIGLQFVRNRLASVGDPLEFYGTFSAFVSHELRHALLDQIAPYEDGKISALVCEVTRLSSYRQYRSPAVADIEEQMNKVFDAVLFGTNPPTLDHIEIVPIFTGEEGTLFASSFIEHLSLLTRSGLVAYISHSLSSFLRQVRN